MEEFKKINNFPDYQISNYGNIKSFKYDKINGKLLKLRVCSNGYYQISLRKNNKTYPCLIHRMIDEIFYKKIDSDKEINHIDGNKKNNYILNLEEINHSDNQKHAYKIGIHKSVKHSDKTKNKMSISHIGKKLSENCKNKLSKYFKGENNPKVKLKDEEVWLINKILNSNYYKSGKITQKFIGKMFGIHQTTISKIKLKKIWSENY